MNAIYGLMGVNNILALQMMLYLQDWQVATLL
jgi:hypothetical protein